MAVYDADTFGEMLREFGSVIRLDAIEFERCLSLCLSLEGNVVSGVRFWTNTLAFIQWENTSNGIEVHSCVFKGRGV